MTKSKWATLRVGILIAVAFAIFSFGIFSIGYGFRPLIRTDLIRAHFHRINGLQAGAPVDLSGVRIGAVDSIRFPDDPRADYVVVEMWIERAALKRVRADSLAQIKTMGLLGDKFVEIRAGSPNLPPVTTGALIASRDPIDYEALLQKKGTDDLIANVMAITQSMRSILEDIDKGHGLLSVLVRGAPERPGEPTVTPADIHKAFDSLARLSSDMSRMAERVNRGRGLAGAMLSDKIDGRRLLANVDHAAASMNDTARKLSTLADRFNRAQGTVPRLLEDRQYADQLLRNMRESSEDLREILDKINSGRGTIGLVVNDPALYNEAKGFLGESGSVGWGIHLLNGIYSLTHPFSTGSPRAPAQPVTITAPVSEPPLATSTGAKAGVQAGPPDSGVPGSSAP